MKYIELRLEAEFEFHGFDFCEILQRWKVWFWERERLIHKELGERGWEGIWEFEGRVRIWVVCLLREIIGLSEPEEGESREMWLVVVFKMEVDGVHVVLWLMGVLCLIRFKFCYWVWFCYYVQILWCLGDGVHENL